MGCGGRGEKGRYPIIQIPCSISTILKEAFEDPLGMRW
jgi:hypothetical protein